MILVAGFVSWDPNLILSAAFTPEHLGMDFFWRRSRACWMRTYFCFSKMINGKIAPSKSRHHQVFARSPTQNPKATHLRPSAQHTLTVLGHGRPCSQKHFTWGHPENCGIAVKHLTYIYRYLSRSKKRRFRSTVSYAIWFYCSVVPRCFYLSNKPYVVITPWPWCPNLQLQHVPTAKPQKISPLFPVAKAGQVEMHFADLQTLATVLLWHRNTVHPLT